MGLCARLCRVFCFKSPMQWRTAGMTVAAAYLIALALTLLILVMIWEGLS